MSESGNDVYAALSSPVRRQILGLLRERAMTAGALAEYIAVAKPTLSGHLNVLKAADLVSVERKGTSLHYRINLSVAEDALSGLMNLFKLGAPKKAQMPKSKSVKSRRKPT